MKLFSIISCIWQILGFFHFTSSHHDETCRLYVWNIRYKHYKPQIMCGFQALCLRLRNADFVNHMKIRPASTMVCFAVWFLITPKRDRGGFQAQFLRHGNADFANWMKMRSASTMVCSTRAILCSPRVITITFHQGGWARTSNVIYGLTKFGRVCPNPYFHPKRDQSTVF